MSHRPQFTIHGTAFDLEPEVLSRLSELADEMKLAMPREVVHTQLRRVLGMVDMATRFTEPEFEALSDGEKALLKGALHGAYVQGVKAWPVQ